MIDDLKESPFAAGFCDRRHRLLRCLAGRVLRDARNIDHRYGVPELTRISDRVSIKIRLTLGDQFRPV